MGKHHTYYLAISIALSVATACGSDESSPVTPSPVSTTPTVTISNAGVSPAQPS